MAEHTPGPWEAGRPDLGTVVDGYLSKWIYAGHQYVAVASGRIEGEWEEVVANARLIAAAPDLLAACKALVEACKLEEPWDTDAFRTALAAVRKVEGPETS